MRRGKRLFERLCLYNGGSSRHMSDSKSIFFNDIFAPCFSRIWTRSKAVIHSCLLLLSGGPAGWCCYRFPRKKSYPPPHHHFPMMPQCLTAWIQSSLRVCVVRIVFNWFYCSELTRDGRILLTALYNEKSILAPIFCECGVYTLAACLKAYTIKIQTVQCDYILPDLNSEWIAL